MATTSTISSTMSSSSTAVSSAISVVTVLFTRGGMGDIGRHVVKQLLARGDVEVRAVSRHIDDLYEEIPSVTQLDGIPRDSDRLIKIQCEYQLEGDKEVKKQLDRAMQGSDAVISCIGCRQPGWESYQATGLPNVIRAMHKAGVDRIVSMSSMGINEDYPGAKWSWITYLWRCMLLTCLRRNRRDITAGEDALRASDLDYVMVRPVGLAPEWHPCGDYTLVPTAYDKNTVNGKQIEMNIAKEDVAKFMIDQVFEPTLHHHATGLASVYGTQPKQQEAMKKGK